jgi:hypothetical protein
MVASENVGRVPRLADDLEAASTHATGRPATSSPQSAVGEAFSHVVYETRYRIFAGRTTEKNELRFDPPLAGDNIVAYQLDYASILLEH